jgi:hypothetical protein
MSCILNVNPPEFCEMCETKLGVGSAAGGGVDEESLISFPTRKWPMVREDVPETVPVPCGALAAEAADVKPANCECKDVLLIVSLATELGMNGLAGIDDCPLSVK